MRNVCIITYAVGPANVNPLCNLINIMNKLSTKLYIIFGLYGENIEIPCDPNGSINCKVIHKESVNIFLRVLNYIWTQVRISYHLIVKSKNISICIFYLGDPLLLPIITAKICRKKTILVMGGYLEKDVDMRNDSLSKVLKLLKKINLILLDQIFIYSTNLINTWNLEKYREKIFIAPEHFINFDAFNIKKPLSKRKNLVGYIGRLSNEKGIQNFVESIPKILEEKEDLDFIIVGNGELYSNIQKYIINESLSDKVKLAGWVDHDELPKHMNELKLLVLPSYTEGLPNVMLEAMACGTPVLATSVGSIPDVIKDSKNGFIMESNSPECIAYNVVRVLNNLNLNELSNNEREFIMHNFSFEVAVDKYNRGLMSLKL